MDLDAWRSKTVFRQEDGGTCRARLTVSLAAGHDGEGDPGSSEDGRRFLLEQLSRLTPEHVRAIFAASRRPAHRRRAAPPSGAGLTSIDEWVAAFEDKVRQIETRRCGPQCQVHCALICTPRHYPATVPHFGARPVHGLSAPAVRSGEPIVVTSRPSSRPRAPLFFPAGDLSCANTFCSDL